MELKIKDRDYVADGAGGLVRVSGWDELLERVLFKLSVRRGSFALAPELGSKLHLLWREKGESRATAAKQYVAEALADEEGLSVTGMELAEKNGFLELRVLLHYENETGRDGLTFYHFHQPFAVFYILLLGCIDRLFAYRLGFFRGERGSYQQYTYKYNKNCKHGEKYIKSHIVHPFSFRHSFYHIRVFHAT